MPQQHPGPQPSEAAGLHQCWPVAVRRISLVQRPWADRSEQGPLGTDEPRAARSPVMRRLRGVLEADRPYTATTVPLRDRTACGILPEWRPGSTPASLAAVSQEDPQAERSATHESRHS